MTRYQILRSMILRSVRACRWMAVRYADDAKLKDCLNSMSHMKKCLIDSGYTSAALDRATANPRNGFTGASREDVRLLREAAA